MDLDGSSITQARQARLSAFPHKQLKTLRESLGKVPHAPWPNVEGCLCVLFTARSGSTYLVRAIEREFAIGRMEEALNPSMVKRKPAAKIVSQWAGQWFAFKAGVPGVIAGEICGFFNRYLPTTSFIRLVRRDIVAQAVSFAKAEQTDRWHLEDKSSKTPIYDEASIAKAVNNIAKGTASLKLYAERAERPSVLVVYEDFAEGDFSRAFATCDAIGAPRRGQDAEIARRPVERMSDAFNEEWRERFIENMKPMTRERIDRYLESIES